MASMAQDAPLLVLPNELQLAIIEHLRQPQDILHLGATCQALHAIATSDDVWRARVEALVHRHARTHTFASSTSLSWNAGAQVYARLVDCLLGSGSKYLGERAAYLHVKYLVYQCRTDHSVLYLQAGGRAPSPIEVG